MFFNLAGDEELCPRMVFLGTGAVYDMRHYEPLMPEEYFGDHVPADETGFSKYVIAKYAEKADHVVELRPFGVFGKYEDYAIRFISNAICKTLFDLPVTLRQNRRFSYVWIDDLVRVVEHFMHARVVRRVQRHTRRDRRAARTRAASGRDVRQGPTGRRR